MITRQSSTAASQQLLAVLRAAALASLPRVRALLAAGANPNATDPVHNRPALVWAAMATEEGAALQLIRVLLEAGADPNAACSRGHTALMRVAKNAPAVQLLLEAGADVARADSDGCTAVFWALKGLLPERVPEVLMCLRNLLAAGASLSATEKNGFNPLAFVCMSPAASPDVVRCLLDAGSNPHASGVGEGTSGDLPPLVMAARFGNVPVLETLLAFGADPSATTSDGRTALHESTYSQSGATCAALLRAGADPNTADAQGQTALMHAAKNRCLPALQLLLAHGADPNRVPSDGWTALMVSAHGNEPDAVELLLEAGADPTAKAPDGRSVARIARSKPQARAVLRAWKERAVLTKAARPNNSAAPPTPKPKARRL